MTTDTKTTVVTPPIAGHPAEIITGFVSVALGLLIAFGVNLTDGQFSAILQFVGFLPAVITLIVTWREKNKILYQETVTDESGYTIWEVIGGIIIALILAWFALEVLEVLANDR